MKTTDVYVEQVLMGMLVLLTALLFNKGSLSRFAGSGNADKIGIAFLIVGAAYLLGILYDRFADTLLQNVEQHCRLAIAIKREQDGEVNEGNDPFPERALKIAILESGQGLAKFADYLRSRIRLSRAIATIMPALSIAFIVSLLEQNDKLVERSWLIVVAGYGVAFMLNLLGVPKKPPRTQAKKSKSKPETDPFEEYKEYKNKKEKRTSGRWRLQKAAREPIFICCVLLFGFAQYLVYSAPNRCHTWLPLAGLMATMFSGWVWFRINQSYLSLLRGYANRQIEKTVSP